MLDLMLPLLLFPVMRHFMTWLRASPATTFLTLDANIAAHKMLVRRIHTSVITTPAPNPLT
jgi:hypothetical protein